MAKSLTFLRRACVSIALLVSGAQVAAETGEFDEPAETLSSTKWIEAFYDSGAGDWRRRWFLDGNSATVSNHEAGMTIDASDGFAVLWTRESFAGDLRIEYDFQRVDSQDSGVNILYIQATGDGQEGCVEDILAWADRRSNAAMRDYFQNMHLYHISYAAFPKDYIRGRRYLPEQNRGLEGTLLSGEVIGTGLFGDDTWVHVSVVKRHKQIEVEFRHPDRVLRCRLDNTDKPGIDRGRIGLRLMPGRVSRFRDVRVYVVAGKETAEGTERDIHWPRPTSQENEP